MEYMGSLRELPDDFTNSMILANKGYNIMNMLARSVLGLYNSDKNAKCIAGWCSHRLEEQRSMQAESFCPAYKMFPQQSYLHLKDRV